MSDTAREAARQPVATAIAKADGWQLPQGDLNTLPDDIKRTYLVQADAAIDAYESELQRQSRDNDVKTMTTYRRADGELVAGDYGWLANDQYFEEEAGDYLEVIQEDWQLVSTKTLFFGDLSRWCAECDTDVDLEQPVNGPVYCSEHKPNTQEQS